MVEGLFWGGGEISIGKLSSCTIHNFFRVKSAPDLLINNSLNTNGGNFRKNQIKSDLIYLMAIETAKSSFFSVSRQTSLVLLSILWNSQ